MKWNQYNTLVIAIGLAIFAIGEYALLAFALLFASASINFSYNELTKNEKKLRTK